MKNQEESPLMEEEKTDKLGQMKNEENVDEDMGPNFDDILKDSSHFKMLFESEEMRMEDAMDMFLLLDTKRNQVLDKE